ncbi:MAG TPA: GNAT family N-acetyltransferase [Terriglobia bacterium]|nr:GNAT family N-acetyltransferase [Terriglobia bacterium]
MQVTIRKATLGDIPALRILIPESVRTLLGRYHTPEQIEGALGTVFGVDTRLIQDGTYFVAEAGPDIVGCGGWSRRRTPFGSDNAPNKDDALLDPSVEPARIRAFFVHPTWERRGIGSRIMKACESAARADGFTRLELTATLAGELLYRRHAFTAVEHLELPLSNGATISVIRMSKDLA